MARAWSGLFDGGFVGGVNGGGLSGLEEMEIADLASDVEYAAGLGTRSDHGRRRFARGYIGRNWGGYNRHTALKRTVLIGLRGVGGRFRAYVHDHGLGTGRDVLSVLPLGIDDVGHEEADR